MKGRKKFKNLCRADDAQHKRLQFIAIYTENLKLDNSTQNEANQKFHNTAKY